MRASIEVADIFRAAGPAYRAVHAGHLSLHQLKVMSAIEHCRTAAMGGHTEACTDCGHWRVAYNSCRNRHCPRCQGAAARTWLAEREADLLPVGYFHVVFTLPAEVADIALQNKSAVYGLLFQAACETMTTIAADPKHLGARIGMTAVHMGFGDDPSPPHIHTWRAVAGRQPLDDVRHPHIQHVSPPVPDPADSAARGRQARLLRRHGASCRVARVPAAPLRKKNWVVYAKPPFARLVPREAGIPK